MSQPENCDSENAAWSGPVIGTIHTPFADKFGVPRQPGLAPAAEGWVRLDPPYHRPEALNGLEQCSHLWLLVGFHRVSGTRAERLTARPPRLGGNRSLGVFATRSPFRPHPLGLSCVRLIGVHPEAGGRRESPGHLHVGGVDLVDGTPILDIKPYLPWTDSIPEATCEWADRRPDGLADLPLVFHAGAESRIDECEGVRPGFVGLLEEVLRADPRPSYQHSKPGREYGMTLAGVRVRWRVHTDRIEVVLLEPANEGTNPVQGSGA